MKCHARFSFIDEALPECIECDSTTKELCILAKNTREGKTMISDIKSQENENMENGNEPIENETTGSFRGIIRELMQEGLTIEQITEELAKRFPDKDLKTLKSRVSMNVYQLKKKGGESMSTNEKKTVEVSKEKQVKKDSIRGSIRELVNQGLSVNEIAQKLVEKFPDKDIKTLKMRIHVYLSAQKKKIKSAEEVNDVF